MRIHSVRGADEESAANVSLALQDSRCVVRFLDAVTEWPDRGRRGILHLSACISVGMSIEVGSPAKKGITKYGFSCNLSKVRYCIHEKKPRRLSS